MGLGTDNCVPQNPGNQTIFLLGETDETDSASGDLGFIGPRRKDDDSRGKVNDVPQPPVKKPKVKSVNESLPDELASEDTRAGVISKGNFIMNLNNADTNSMIL